MDLNPQVRATDVVLPPNAVFVVANSLAVSNKAEAAPRRYNLRVVECRLAAMMVALALGATPEACRCVALHLEKSGCVCRRCALACVVECLSLAAELIALALGATPEACRHGLLSSVP